jgi:hypothetical protein
MSPLSSRKFTQHFLVENDCTNPVVSSRTSVPISMTSSYPSGYIPWQIDERGERSRMTAQSKSKQHHLVDHNIVDMYWQHKWHSVATDTTWGYGLHQQTLSRLVNNDGTLLLPQRNVVGVSTCTARGVVQQKNQRGEKGQTSSPCNKNNQSKYSSNSERISTFLS